MFALVIEEKKKRKIEILFTILFLAIIKKILENKNSFREREWDRERDRDSKTERERERVQKRWMEIL